MIRRGIGVQSFVAGGGTDADALAFITAAGITDATQQSAINTLVTSLKTYGIWTKMKAIYPFVGGTASTHKFNLKDPRDLDAAFRLVFSGGMTHSSNGILFNGVNGFGQTYLNDNILNNVNKHISMYQRNILSSPSNASMGISERNRFYMNFGGNNFSTLGMQQSSFTVATPQQGFFLMSKISSGSFKYFQNLLSPIVKNGSDATLSLNYVIGANTVTGGSILENAAADIAFASIGDGLTDTEAANFYTAVQAYQTTLSRNV